MHSSSLMDNLPARSSCLIVLLVGLGTASCAPQTSDFGELHAYNDVWTGSLSMDRSHEQVRLTMQILVTQFDESEALGSNNLYKMAYATIGLDTMTPIAGHGTADHWNLIQRSELTSSGVTDAIPEREFVNISLHEVVALEDGSSAPVYEEWYRRFMDRVSSTSRAGLEINLERKGEVLEGVLVDRMPSTANTVRVGSISLRRQGTVPESTFVSSQVVRASPYQFESTILPNDVTSYVIRLIER